MLLRISLVVAILAGLAALYFSHFKVTEKINTLTTDLGTAQAAQKTAEDGQRTAKADAKKSKEELTKANQELDDTKSELATTKSSLTVQLGRANELAEKLDAVTKTRNEAQQTLAQYEAANVKPHELKELRERLVKTTTERDTFTAENKIILREVARLKSALSRYEGPTVEVELPLGLRGRVVAVDPKYDFVVLDIGSTQGVLEYGKMLVSRDGKYVAKVRITKVEPNRSIANVLPDDKQTEVMEGDFVIIQ
jgi:outer membrane murein-binding lipoprotein Lpp